MRYLLLTFFWAAGVVFGLLSDGLIPGEHENYSTLTYRSDTLKVVTWNIEWFGSDYRGPDDNELQMKNVVEVFDSLRADLYALQEIFDQKTIDKVTTRIQGNYNGFIAGHINQSQRLAFIYNSDKIDSLDAGPAPDFTDYYWAGRIPFTFTSSIKHSGGRKEFIFINQHGKAFSDAESYERRVKASGELQEFISGNMEYAYIFLGDYNDDVVGSIRDGEESPYKNLVDDKNFRVITLSLSESRDYSYSNSAGSVQSMIDHITINKPLFRLYVTGSEYVHRADYIPDFLTTTSDHYPIIARFNLNGEKQGKSAAENHAGIKLFQNYPNPFNPLTVIPFELERESEIKVTLYDIQGRKVMPVANQIYPAGFHELTVNGSELAGGIYLYRLESNEISIVKKMTLIK